MEAIELTPALIQSFDIGKVYRDSDTISTLDFSHDGQYLLSGSNSIRYYNVFKGTLDKIIPASSSMIHFAHHPSGFLSANSDHLQYWSVQASRIIHSFHIKNISCLDLCPKNDLVIASNMKQLSIFDLNSKKNIGILELGESVGNILCKFDSLGLIFVVAYPVIDGGKYKNIIQLFDTREFSGGPFAKWTFDGAELISVDFSSDGQNICLNNKSSQIFLIDSIDGRLKGTFQEYVGNSVCPVVFSPDSKYFFCGCEKSFGVAVGSTENCHKIYEIKGNTKSIKAIAWSSEHCVMATGNEHLVLWVPDYLKGR